MSINTLKNLTEEMVVDLINEKIKGDHNLDTSLKTLHLFLGNIWPGSTREHRSSLESAEAQIQKTSPIPIS